LIPEINDKEIQTYIDKSSQLPIIVIEFRNVHNVLKKYISCQLVTLGILPIDVNVLKTSSIENIKLGNDIIIFESTDDYLNIAFKENEYTIPKGALDEPSNMMKILSEIFGDFGKSPVNDTKEIKSIIYNKKINKAYLSKFIGEPYIVLYDNIDFENDQRSLDSIDLKNDKIIFVWDNYVLYADGSISDLSFTWKMKVSNTPLDYIFSGNRLFLLDVTGQLVVLNLKTRRFVFSKTFEGSYTIKLEPNNVLNVYSTNGRYIVINEKETKFDSKQVEEQRTKSMFPIVYPSILNLYVTPFGYFYEDIFIGQQIKFTYIKDKIAYVVTEVGTWKINISDWINF
ncbi:MAG: hypothetical protein ABDH59_04050, partial [Fervidobacterium sp.]